MEELPEQSSKTRNLVRGGLTYKQDMFAKLIAEGKTLYEAYMEAYQYSPGQRPKDQINSDAFKLKSLPKVIDRIHYWVERINSFSVTSPAEIRSRALQTILSVANNEQAKDSDRLKAAELLGKVKGVGLFEGPSNEAPLTRVSSVLDIEARIRALAALSKPDQPIEIIDQSRIEPS